MSIKSPEVVVTGMGILNAAGDNIEKFTKSLYDGKSGIGRIKQFAQESIPVDIGAELTNFNFAEQIENNKSLSIELSNYIRKSGRTAPFPVQASIISSLEAWSNANLDKEKIDREEVGLVVAGQNIAQHYQYDMAKSFHAASEKLNPSYALHFMDTDHVGVLSDIFRINGEGFTTGGASASGNVGIIQATRLIKSGAAKACLVVGSVADFSPVEMLGFYIIGAMGGRKFKDQPDKACRPFDMDHEGFILGQGTAALVLETVESAKSRKVPILAEIAGGAIALDGNRQPNPNKFGEIRAMQNAVKQAGLSCKDVQYINAHGSSSIIGDEVEIEAIKTVFNDTVPELWINSTKTISGHCLWSAGITEVIASIIQMNEGFVHPNLNLDNPIDKTCRFAGKKSESAEIGVALSNSFGFGGINTSLVIKKRER